jgi:flagellar hook-associated protein 2
MVTFGGLATGLDTKALITGLMSVERIPLTKLESQQKTLNSAKSALSSLLSKFAEIKTKATALKDEQGVGGFAATASSDAVAVSTSGALTPGSYSIDVIQLAAEHKTKTAAVASSTADLGHDGTLEITVGSSDMVGIDLDPGDSLAEIATKINQSGAKVNAAVVHDGSSYHLLVRGKETGAQNAVTFGGTTLGLDTGTYQDAQDARIVLDDEILISRSTNQFKDVVPGLTLVAKKKTTEPLTVTVEGDPSSLIGKMKDLVGAYNGAVGAAHVAIGFGALNASNKELAGDATVRRSLDMLSSGIGSAVSGVSGKYNLLAAVGLHLTRDGKLELDETKLKAAMEDDASAVTRLLAGNEATGTKGAMDKLVEMVDRIGGNSSAMIDMRIKGLGAQASRLDGDIATKERRLGEYEAMLLDKFTQLELLVSQIQSQGSALAGITTITTG